MSLVITSETHRDHRGLLLTYPFMSAQFNICFNDHTGTLRGLHYREPPGAKLIICIKGSLYDVVVELETNEITPMPMKVGDMRYIPEGFAHGFQTLEEKTEIFYLLAEPYVAELERGIKYDSFNIKWPLPITSISEKDNELPRLSL